MNIKNGQYIKVTLINKGEYHHLTEGSNSYFKASNVDDYLFALVGDGKRLIHFWKWHKGNGLFELSHGMIVKLTPCLSFWQKAVAFFN